MMKLSSALDTSAAKTAIGAVVFETTVATDPAIIFAGALLCAA